MTAKIKDRNQNFNDRSTENSEMPDDYSCAICGLRNHKEIKKSKHNVKSPEQDNLFFLWQKDCATTLTDILFKGYGDDYNVNFYHSPLVDYFQSVGYCSSCKQIVRDLDFTARQIRILQIQLKRFSTIIHSHIYLNYEDIEEKSEDSIVEERLNTLLKREEHLDNYSQKEILEIIHKVVNSKEKTIEVTRCIEKLKMLKSLKFGQNDSTNEDEYYSDPGFGVDSPASEIKFEVEEIDTEIDAVLEFSMTAGEDSDPKPDSMHKIKSRKEKRKLNNDFETETIEVDLNKKPRRNQSNHSQDERFTTVKVKKNSNVIKKMKDKQTYQCEKCEKVFSSNSKLQRHVRSHEKGLKQKEKSIDKSSKEHQCEICGAKFTNSTSLTRHFAVHNQTIKSTCGTCGKVFTDSHLLKSHAKCHEKKIFRCSKCGKEFGSRRDVQRHEESHERREKTEFQKFGKLFSRYKYFCKFCGMGYVEEEELTSHYSKAHQGPNPFSCAFCTEIYSNSINLRNHMKEVHPSPEDTKNYKCTLCSKSFKYQSILKDHMKLHGDPSLLFKCEKCTKTFVRKIDFERHLETHNTEIKFICETCGKGYRHQMAYKSHLKFHNKSIKCSVCGKLFASLQICKRHEVTHTDLKDFNCQVCNKAFNNLYNLGQHEKLHNRVDGGPNRVKKIKTDN